MFNYGGNRVRTTKTSVLRCKWLPSATNCSLFAGTFSFQEKTFDAEPKSSAKIIARGVRKGAEVLNNDGMITQSVSDWT